MVSEEIRQRFLNFFKQRGHLIQPSSPLSIRKDPHLLFTIAGMVPFKDFFLGKEKPPSPRLCSSQLCFRTDDLKKVGETPYHHTLFEMLGNFSFGNYFKEEACEWGWEFITKELSLKRSCIWITIFHEDEETYRIWRKIGIPSSRIIRKEKEDNFWAMGEVGPCGPDTEIFFDRGEKFGCGKVNCEPGCDCERWVEIWNLVFMEFNRDKQGKLSSLPSRNIDTGMSLERVCSLVQGVGDNYRTDLFIPIMKWLKEILPSRGHSEKALKIICDHLRALTFLIGEEIFPSNTGKGYMVRKVLRRAYRYGRKLGMEGPFLYKGVAVIAEVMGKSYPYLLEKKEKIARVIKGEEKNFERTLNYGMKILETFVEKLKKENKKLISSQDLFKLYDTYGLPLDITNEIAEEEGLGVDKKGMEKLLVEQRTKGRENFEKRVEKEEIKISPYSLKQEIKKTEFKGYEVLKLRTCLEGIFKEKEIVQKLSEGEEGELILSSSPFYPEGGGQVGDKGKIFTSLSRAEVINTQRLNKEIILHKVRVLKGEFKEGDKVMAEVDKERREKVSRAHTSTHLLQASLREILGEHVKQSGSLVEEDRLRFDFTHFSPLSEKEKEEIEFLLNRKIRENLLIKIEEIRLEEARRRKAVALFKERYKDKVRVVDIGGFSLEVCGGTHLLSTGQIGMAKIISEEGVASGIRRIEILVGEKALKWVMKKEDFLKKITQELKTSEENILIRIKEEKKILENKKKEIKTWQREILKLKINELLKESFQIGEVKIIKGRINVSAEVLREAAEKIKDKLIRSVVVLSSVYQDKVIFVTTSTQKDLPAHKILKKVAELAGGNAGGRWDFAQGGASEPSKINQALESLPHIIEKMSKQGNL